MKFRTFSVLTLLALLLVSVVPLTAQDDAFPVTIEHKYGEITLDAAPERIVALGYTEQDPYFALGVAPVAIRYWYGDAPNAIFPWAIEAADGAEPEVLEMGYGTLNYEAILALEPDLISAIDAGITEEEYETLSQIAPTLVESAEYVRFGSPWQDTTLAIGTALGMSEEAETIVADLEAKLETVREENPVFDGATVAVAYNSLGSYGYYTGQDGRGRFFTDLGFVVPDELNEIAGDNFFADISEERVELLDRDLLVFLALQFFEDGSAAAREAIETDPLIQQLEVAQDDRILYIDDQFDDALQFSTVLSIDFLLDNLVPEIATTLGDDMAMRDMCEDGFRLVEHELETTCVPVDPQRVVVLHPVTDIDNLIALDVVPIGVGIYTNRYPIAPYLAANDYLTVSGEAVDPDEVATLVTGDGLPEARSVGMWNEPNLEIILELEPDLIIARIQHEEIYDQLTAIAPTVVYPFTQQSFESHLLNLADAVNRTEAAEALLSDFDARIAELSESLGENAGEIEVSIVRIRPEELRLYVANSQAGAFLDRIGLGRPETQQTEGEDNFAFLTVSLEEIDRADGDIIFVWAGLDGTNDQYDDLSENPLWQTLEGVQAEQVYLIDEAVWFAPGIIGANLMLDDVQTFIVENDTLRSSE